MSDTQDSAVSQIRLQRITPIQASFRLVGDTPLVTHAWSTKAREMMAAAQQQRTRSKKMPKDPKAEYEGAFYRLPDGEPGIPAVAFKSAMVDGARNFEGVTMRLLRQALFVPGIGPEQLIRIDGDPEMWEAPVRVGMGTADLRYRPRFWPWSVDLTVRFNPVVLNYESVAALLDAGGMSGVGEWRPSAPKSNTGSYGTFHVDAE